MITLSNFLKIQIFLTIGMAVGPKTLVILLLAFNILKFTSGLGFCFWCKSQLVLRWTNIVILQIFVCIRGNPTAKIRACLG